MGQLSEEMQGRIEWTANILMPLTWPTVCYKMYIASLVQYCGRRQQQKDYHSLGFGVSSVRLL